MSKVPYEVYTEDVEALSVLSPDGEIVNKDMMPTLSDDQLKEIMYRMVFTRTWDDRAVNLAVKVVLVSMLQYLVKKLQWLVVNLQLKKKTLYVLAIVTFRNSYGMDFLFIKHSCTPVDTNMVDKFQMALMY